MRTLPGFLQIAFFGLVTMGSAHAQRDLTDIPDPDPESQRRTFEVAEGMEIHLFASDPMISNPIHMNWDARGRLWVACSPIYPHIHPGKRHDDKIVVLEDRDGDGRADRHTVFVDDLLIPTAVLPGDGGAYVANSTEILHLRDDDGDGKADHSRVVLSGFGTEDTHHIIHTFRFGPDCRFYFNQSIYIHSHVETPNGVRRLAGGGVWRFRPESMDLEVFCRGLVNSWGHVFDRWGQSFVTDGAYTQGINHAFPGAMFIHAHGATRILSGLSPGQPKHCGLELLDGRHLPPEWSGSFITADFRGNRVNRFVLSEDGSSYAARQVEDVVSTRHVAFRPVDLKMGPDGAIYIADLYNPIIQHGEVSFRDPRRDHKHGRIWRITARGRPTVDPPRIVGASVKELLEFLKMPEHGHRLQARLELKSRGKEAVLPALKKWLAALDPKDPQFEHLRLEALWLRQALDVVTARLLEQILGSDDHRARAAAVRVLGQSQGRIDHALKLLEEAVLDGNPRVRLEAVNALRQAGTISAFKIAMRALEQDVDKSIDYSLWLTARELSPEWLPALDLDRGELDLDGEARKLLFALQSLDSENAVPPLVKMLENGNVSGDSLGPVLSLLADHGDGDSLRRVFDVLTSRPTLSNADRVEILSALRRAESERNIRPTGSLDPVANLLSTDAESVRAEVAHLVGVWGLSSARKSLGALLRNPEASHPARRGAALGLAALGKSAGKSALDDIVAASGNVATRALAIEALARIDLPGAARKSVDLLEQLNTDTEAAIVSELFSALIRPREGAKLLESALDGRKIAPKIALLGVETAEGSGREMSGLIAVLQKSGDLPPTELGLDSGSMSKLIAEMRSNGDLARGEAVYRRAELACTSCHSIAGAGGQVGPDLMSIGASAPADYIIESLLDPNKKIKEGYHPTEILTRDFEFYTGTLAHDDEKSVTLRIASGDEIRINKSQITERHTRGRSVMPSGLVSRLPRGEFLDLVRFLSALGRDHVVPRDRVVRRWRLLTNTETEEEEKISVHFEGFDHSSWVPAYSDVSGELPATVGARGGYFELEVSIAGKVGMKINDPRGLRYWIDGVVTPAEKTTVISLPRGQHRIGWTVDRPSRGQQALRIEIVDVPGSRASVQIVSGR